MATVHGLQIPDLVGDLIPVDAVVILKALDADGDMTVTLQTTEGLLLWDIAGMLAFMSEDVRQQMARMLDQGDG